ncbi:hypothetical protein DFJ63DRAFT_175857 [Scheffersomyces coipomensis]|uniref:uncharacterized protein n=1 Tax=Scheffersomyces coipomensis TaxID=1788519 RepID=UPI00315CE1CB
MTVYSKDLQENTNLHKFITDFYKNSDIKPPITNDPYLKFFTESLPVIIMASAKFEGTKAIEAMRQGMWKFVTHRHHVAQNVATIVEGKTYLVNGFVEYTLLNGNKLSSDWAAYVKFAEGSELKMEEYQVYLDTAPMKAAIAEI